MALDPPPRRGRRDNGLPAASFVPLADVDPRVGEHLLDLLKLAGVPAYLEPSSDVEPYTRTVALPSPPTDRLWVDREQRSAAREIVEAEATASGSGARLAGAPAEPVRSADEPADERPSTGLSDLDEERAWQQIVAGWDTADDDRPVAPWPVPEDEGSADRSADDAGTGRREDRTADALAEMDALDRESVRPAPPEPADEEEHFVPPPPPPVPRLSKQAVVGILLIATGILLMAAPGVLGFDETEGFGFGVIGVIAGGVLLFMRLRHVREEDDDPDDGAVV